MIPDNWKEARCSAHGNRKCTQCSVSHSSCNCHEFGFDFCGMHWDTCPGRNTSLPAKDGFDEAGVTLETLVDITESFRVGSQEWTWTEEFADMFSRDQILITRELAQSIVAEGIREPILLGNDGRVWDGHHRITLAWLLGIDRLPCTRAPEEKHEYQKGELVKRRNMNARARLIVKTSRTDEWIVKRTNGEGLKYWRERDFEPDEKKDSKSTEAISIIGPITVDDQVRLDDEEFSEPLQKEVKRPWTEDVKNADNSTTVTVKRACNGCGKKLGDITDEEMRCAIEGLPTPDVRDECPDCSNPPLIKKLEDEAQKFGYICEIGFGLSPDQITHFLQRHVDSKYGQLRDWLEGMQDAHLAGKGLIVADEIATLRRILDGESLG